MTFGLFARVQGGDVGALCTAWRGFWGNYVALRGVRAENEALQQAGRRPEVRLQEQRALARAPTQLQELMDLKASTPLPTLAAEVIAGNPNPGMRTMTIDRGTADGVQADMAVIAPAGIVGRVIGTPAAHAARVQLLIDRNAAAGAVTERTRAGGMVVGRREGSAAAMELVSNLADVKPGDAVVASGVDGIYPEGFMIGHGRDIGARRRAVPHDHGAPGGGFLEPRGSARRAGARRAAAVPTSPRRRQRGR